MSAWVLWPRDPLVVRDGRPNQGRSESATLSFPWPGTVAGVLRTRVGSDAEGRFVARDLDALRRIAVRGALLTDGRAVFVPSPRDALAVRGEPKQLYALHPLDEVGGALFDEEAPPRVVGFDEGEVPPKKAELLPAWWPWAAFSTWLSAPATLARATVEATGLRALPRERRVHVKLTADRVAEDAMLFETEGLRFARGADPARLDADELGLLVDVTEGTALRAGFGPFAGERRLVRWEPAAVTLPRMPDDFRAHLASPAETVRVRVLLLTPGCFTAGAQPSLGGASPLRSRDGVTVSPVASIVPRPETLSGWDFETKQPKGTRRLVPAGSVYWLDLTGSPEARAAWAEGVWMHNVSDEAQDRHDGYGLAALGVG